MNTWKTANAVVRRLEADWAPFAGAGDGRIVTGEDAFVLGGSGFCHLARERPDPLTLLQDWPTA